MDKKILMAAQQLPENLLLKHEGHNVADCVT